MDEILCVLFSQVINYGIIYFIHHKWGWDIRDAGLFLFSFGFIQLIILVRKILKQMEEIKTAILKDKQ